MPTPTFDAIILGAGGVGSAALWQLAARGARVLAIDRFAPPHSRGSTHGATRIIRQAYFEHPDYVPLLVESYWLWRELEQHRGAELLLQTGLLQVGPPDGQVVRGVVQAAELHGLAIEQLSAAEVERRWQTFRVPPELCGVFEPTGGLLLVEKCVEAFLAAARDAGGELLTNVTVHGWSSAGADLVVQTDAGEFRTPRLIVAAGPWAGELLGSLQQQLTVHRQVLAWYRDCSPQWSVDAATPCFLFELPEGVYYGFPALDERGVKVADHAPAELVADPLSLDRRLRPTDREPLDRFVAAALPGVTPPITEHAVCMYTCSPDEHFLVDQLRDDPRITYCAGLSGHGYKFAPVLGRALGELALDGGTSLPIDFLGANRLLG